jgi:hypothetical protein
MDIRDREKNIDVLGIYSNKDEVSDDEVDDKAMCEEGGKGR